MADIVLLNISASACASSTAVMTSKYGSSASIHPPGTNADTTRRNVTLDHTGSSPDWGTISGLIPSLSYLYLDTQIPADCNGQSVRGCQPVLADRIRQAASTKLGHEIYADDTDLSPNEYSGATSP